jgi:hypothetical protein
MIGVDRFTIHVADGPVNGKFDEPAVIGQAGGQLETFAAGLHDFKRNVVAGIGFGSQLFDFGSARQFNRRGLGGMGEGRSENGHRRDEKKCRHHGCGGLAAPVVAVVPCTGAEIVQAHGPHVHFLPQPSGR